MYIIKYGEWNTLILKTMSKVAILQDSPNIGGIISGVSVTLILIITVSVAVTLIIYNVLRYNTFSHCIITIIFLYQAKKKKGNFKIRYGRT